MKQRMLYRHDPRGGKSAAAHTYRARSAAVTAEDPMQEKDMAKKRKACIIATAVGAVLIIAIAIVLRGITDTKAYNNYMHDAQQNYYSGNYNEALTNLRKAADIDSTDECLMMMVDCYESLGNYDKALEVLRKMDTQSSAVASRIASIESRRRRLEESALVTVAGRQYGQNTTGLVLDNMGLTEEIFSELLKLYSLDNLSIAGNSISDISELAQLGGLVTLNLSNNRITDITPLASLTGLRTLYLDNNPIRDLGPLCALTNLSSLSIKGMTLTESQLETLSKALPNCAIHSEQASEDVLDISFGGITFKSDVTTLDLSNMGIRDISALSSCKYLTRLDLSGNSVSDLTPLMNIPGLEWLDISSNDVSDLRPLMGLASLKYVDASDNYVSSTAAAGAIANLKELNLSNNPINNFSGLKKLKYITKLNLNNSYLKDKDLVTLAQMQSLQELMIEDNPELSGEAVDQLDVSLLHCVVTHSVLAYSVNLDGNIVASDAIEIDFTGFGIDDISAVANLSCLETVRLGENYISNIYPLQYSSSRFTIRCLDLSGNNLEDITPLAILQSVETLDLTNNNISSTLPLLSMGTLRHLYLSGNPLSDEQIAELRSTLINCEIIFE